MNNVQLSNIQHIQDACKQDKLVIFVGAGVSANSGVPLWGRLIESLKQDLPEALKEETDALKIAQLYKDSRGDKEYIEKIKETLMYGKTSPNLIHYAILDLKPCHIITTNYDDLIEQAVLQKFQQYYVIRRDADLPYVQYQNTLIKMHGDFEANNIVLTENDYYNYSTNFPLIQSYVQSLFASKLILFVGFSFNDINLKIILNSVSNILQENMQRVYLLTDNDVDPIQRTYYENKSINIVSICPDDIDNYLCKYNIKVDSEQLVAKVGKVLYKQLVFINSFRKNQDLIKYICNYIDSYKDEIRVLGDGFRYIIPQNEQLHWNYHSSGLQIESPYVKNIKNQLKTFAGRRKFVIQYGGDIVELRKQAYLNRFFSLDDLKLVNETFLRHLNEYIPYRSVEYFYDLDYTNLWNRIRVLRAKGYKYNIDDLELPFILYRLGDYYQSYLMYKELAVITWKYKKYILYFICMYNMYSIRYGVQHQLFEREDVDVWSILKEIEAFDLPSILNKLPIDAGIKHVFEDLLSYRSQGNKLVESESFKEKITSQRKSAERGGRSMNSNIYLLESKFYQDFSFCNDNYIICDNNRFSQTLYHNVIIGILNSHVTPAVKRGKYFQNTRIEKLTKEHLLLLLFHISSKELLEIMRQYDIKNLTLGQDACKYLIRLIENSSHIIKQSNDGSYKIINEELFRKVVQNIMIIVNRIDSEMPEIYNIYPTVNYLLGIQYFWSFDNELSTLVYKYKPGIDDAILLLNHLIFRSYRQNTIHRAIFNLSLILKEHGKEMEDIHSIEDIPEKNNYFFVGSFFSVLTIHVQREIVAYFKQSIHGLYTLLVLYENYRIPILEEDLLRKALKTPDFSDDTYVNKEVFSCSVLRRVRKNDKHQSLHSLIDDFAVRNECLQFFLNPIEFEKIDKIEPVWVCYCEDWIIQNLLENRVIKEKVKEYITNDTLGKWEFDHMWKLL